MTGRLRLLYLCHEYPPASHGGIGSFTHSIATGMVRRGHRVVVIGMYTETKVIKDEVIDGVRVIRLPGSNLSGWLSFFDAFRMNKYMQRLVKEERIDIVEGAESSYGLYWRKLPKVRIIRMHGGHTFFRATLGEKPNFLRHWLEKISFLNASDNCAVSCFVATETSLLLRLKERPITVIPNPVDINLFSPRPETVEINGRIVFIGTVCEKKGIRQLIQAMPEIICQVPEAHLQVIGRDTLNPDTGRSYIQSLKDIIPAQILDKIHFIGTIERHSLPNWIAPASVCIYPSHMESQGIAVIEAMAMAKMVIASQTGPGPEVIQDGQEGFLCDPHDPNSIAKLAIKALKNPTIRQNLGRKAREKTDRKFSLENVLSKNEEFYHQTLYTQT